MLYDFEPDFDAEGFDAKRMQAARDQQTSRVVPAIDVAATDDAQSPRLISLQMQAEEVGRARNAGIVVAHRLLALPGDLFGRPGRNLADKVPQIFLDPFLILRGWRNNLCRKR